MKMREVLRKGVSVLMACVIGLLALNGCQHPSITVNTDPSGAKVYISEQYIGESPVTNSPAKWPWEPVDVKAEKKGYDSQFRQSTHIFNGTGIVVLIVGIFIWPVLLGLLAPGCWNLSPDRVDLKLEKAK